MQRMDSNGARASRRDKPQLAKEVTQASRNGGANKRIRGKAPPKPKVAEEDSKTRENDDVRKIIRDAPQPKSLQDSLPEWAIGAWAYYATIYASIFGILCATPGIIWSQKALRVHNDSDTLPEFYDEFRTPLHLYTSVAGVTLGGVLIVSHTVVRPLRTSGTQSMIILRAVFMLVSGVPLLLNKFTSFQGFCYLTIGIMYLMSAQRREQGSFDHGKDNVQAKFWIGSVCGIFTWITKQRARGSFGRIFAILVWIGINAGLFVYKYKNTEALLAEMIADPTGVPCFTGEMKDSFDECANLTDAYTRWIPLAKGTGFCLNFNCALIFLLITQAVIRRLHEWSESRGWQSYVFGWLPLHKAVLLHKYIAIAILVQAGIHTMAHLMALSITLPIFSRSIPNSMSTSGLIILFSVWITGFMLLYVIVIMYAVSMSPCRRLKFEYFIYTHKACAWIFVLLLFVHSPIFWIFGTIPFLLYVIDRASRSYAESLCQSRLLEVSFASPVIELVFSSPISYKVGQYVNLKCPHLSKFDGHPFTISSAPESGMLSLHIKVWPGGWTEKMKELMFVVVADWQSRGAGTVTLEADGAFSCKFEQSSKIGRLLCGISMWKGKPLFQIDGPHSAPAVHFRDYKTILVVGSGIGLTPLHSIIRCLTEFVWKGTVDSTHVKTLNLYAVWLCPHDNIAAYKWFMKSLSRVEIFMQLLPSNMASCVHFEMHLFVTSYTRPEGRVSSRLPSQTSLEIDGRKIVRHYTTDQLFDVMDDPSTDSSQFSSVMSKRKQNRMGCTYVWNGRPMWDALFRRLKVRHQSTDSTYKIGVFYCGAKPIARDLQATSIMLSDRSCIFEVRKENF